MSDPFASVQVPSANGATATLPRKDSDPFTSSHDMDDPFATSSDLRGGGDFVPSPGLEILDGRLLVMIPRTLQKDAKDPNDPTGQKTREVYTVDLTVLDGGHLSYPYKVKGDPEKGTQDEWKQWEADCPFTVKGYWVPQGALIGKLKSAHADGRPYLGVLSMGPTKNQRDRGVTAAQVQADYQGWIQRGKVGNRPMYSWRLTDPSAEQRAAALQWWKANKDQIAPITPAQN